MGWFLPKSVASCSNVCLSLSAYLEVCRAESEALKQESEAKAKVEAEARAKTEAEARAKTEAEARAKVEAEARAKTEAEARAKLEAARRDHEQEGAATKQTVEAEPAVAATMTAAAEREETAVPEADGGEVCL